MIWIFKQILFKHFAKSIKKKKKKYSTIMLHFRVS